MLKECKDLLVTLSSGFFPATLSNMSEEQGGHFYQDLKNMKIRYQGKSDCYMIADYFWSDPEEKQEWGNLRRNKIVRLFT